MQSLSLFLFISFSWGGEGNKGERFYFVLMCAIPMTSYTKGAASANRLEAMKPYFATMDAMVPLCERRARLSTWGHGGHGSNVAFGQQTDMMGCGPEGWSVMDHCPEDVGG